MAPDRALMMTQTQQPTPAAPPPPPGRPLTNADLDVMSRIRAELVEELAAVRARRQEVIAEIRSVQASNLGPGIQIRRVQALDRLVEQHDGRILQIGNDLSVLGQRLSDGLLVAETAPPPPFPTIPPDFPADAITTVGIVAVAVFLGPISLAIARLIWKRGTATRAAPSWDGGPRLDRLEHAVDAVAVEIERMSEGQRFVTRLLTSSPNFDVNAAQLRVPEPVPRANAGKSSDEH